MIKMKIKRREISSKNKTFFIADIAANHDGKFNRAIKLIDLAIKAGADAVKFQHHDVKKYVSDYGFKALGTKQSHQKIDTCAEYLDKGWPLIPLHSVTKEGCSCENPKCSSIAKHPRTKNGLKDSSLDFDIIKMFFNTLKK